MKRVGVQQMEGVFGGAIRKWNGIWTVLQTNEKGHGRCYKQMEGVLGGAAL